MVKLAAVALGASLITACFIAYHACDIAAHALVNNFEYDA